MKQCQLAIATFLLMSLECYARNLRQLITLHPSASVCQREGSFRYPIDCRRFYRCVDWSHEGKHFSIFHFVCPDGTVFDEDLQVCNFPWWTKPCLQGMPHPPSVIIPGSGTFGMEMFPSGSEDSMIQSGTNHPTGHPFPTDMASIMGPAMKPMVPGIADQMFPGSIPMVPNLPFGQESIIPLSDGSDSVSGSLVPGEDSMKISSLAEGGSQLGMDTKPSTVAGSQLGQGSNSNGSNVESENLSGVQAGGSHSGLGETSTQKPGLQTGQEGSESTISLSQSGSGISNSSSGSSPAESAVESTSTGEAGSLPGEAETSNPGSDENSSISTLGTEHETGSNASQSEYPNNGGDSSISLPGTGGTSDQHLSENQNEEQYKPGNDIVNGIENGTISVQVPVSGNSSSSVQSVNDNSNDIDAQIGTLQEKYMVMEGSIFNCPAPGFYPYESNCLEFYVCLEVLPGILFAEQLYRCPDRYLFDDVSRRCLREGKVNCTKFSLESVSPLGKENVLVVLEQFLDAFFNTPLHYRANVIG